MMKKLALVGVVIVAASAPAYANLVQNGSFETGITPGGFTTVFNGDSTSIDGWTVTGNSVDYIGSYWAASDGSRSIDLSGNDVGGLTQTISGLNVGQSYTLSFDYAANPDFTGPRSMSFSLGSFTGTLVNVTNSPNAGWLSYVVTFVYNGGGDLLSFTQLDGGPYGVALDNVDLNAVPVPAALPLLGSALAGGAFLGWRRRKAAKA
ncbi:DUF642 domain-containing protein [Aestuariivirga sp.]|uniref:DUF642 domain-containing protein n=1 Tax=Aestuariivirga sp. TaxID=2650926 RepID=UPI0039E57808